MQLLIKKVSTFFSHLEEQAKVRNEIGQKRRTIMENLLRKAKKSFKLDLIDLITDFSDMDLHILYLRDTLCRLSKVYLVYYCGVHYF